MVLKNKMIMKKVKVTLTPEQKEFQKIKRFINKRFPGAHTVARAAGSKVHYQVVDGQGHTVVDPELMLPPATTVTEAWTNAKYGVWFTNMVRKSCNAFSDEKIYRQLAKENKNDD